MIQLPSHRASAKDISGWSKTVPTTDGLYWWKSRKNNAEALQVAIVNGMATSLGVPRPVDPTKLRGWWAKAVSAREPQ